jgi:predicted DNA-binding transcriptional regulator YafY
MNCATHLAQGGRPLAERLRERLRREHRGAAAGIRGRDLAALLGATPRELRRAVEALRDAGVPVGAHPESGYYWPATADEVERTAAFLDSRAWASLRQSRKLRRWARREFGPQLHLDLEESA